MTKDTKMQTCELNLVDYIGLMLNKMAVHHLQKLIHVLVFPLLTTALYQILYNISKLWMLIGLASKDLYLN